jgi:hypothetical protein
MHALKSSDFAEFYAKFDLPVTAFDCGAKCAPYNEYGVPFCCDTNHTVPSAYLSEWQFLETNTDLWRPWKDEDADQTKRLRNQLPKEQILIECLGHKLCQRSFRSVTCRAFPFFPYISKGNKFLGLSYYWEYEDRCWVISHLDTVMYTYRNAFVNAYENLFEYFPEEFGDFRYHSIIMRRKFGRQKRKIPLLHRDGTFCQITPKDGQLERVDWVDLPKFGPYEVADRLPFPDEK